MLTHTSLAMEGKLTWIIGLQSFHSPDWVYPGDMFMLYTLATLNLPLTSWPRGARLKVQETSYKCLHKSHIFNSILTLDTSSPIPLWSCREDRVDSLQLFLHSPNSARSKLFCSDRLSLLTALHSHTPVAVSTVQSRCYPCHSPWISFGKTHSMWGWERRKELWWALIDFPGWMTGGEAGGIHHETHFSTVWTQPVASLM